MSSALAMVLTAAMAVPASGPEKVSAEMEQGLDLRGEWEGVWWNASHEAGQVEWTRDGWITGKFSYNRFQYLHCDMIRDEGAGQFRYERFDGDREVFGIYRQDGDRLVLCIGRTGAGRPASFTPDDHRCLLILPRVKPRK